jgi:long-subunit fatty acid transport protein
MVGGDYKLTQNWIASAGYHFCTSPVARANVLPMGSTTWQHHMSIGLRYETPKWWAGCGYTIAFPTWLRGSGWSKIPLGFDYGRAEMTQLENAIVLGGGYTFK